MNEPPANVWADLAAFFDPDEVKWKSQSVKGNRALAVAYVDARVVMDRLDDVLGPGNWQTTYREIPDGIVCRLRVRAGGEWFEHEDVGSFSEQQDDGDKLKAAFSDALKRVAVHLGIGRYLYRLPHQWVDYSPEKKGFVAKPQLPKWALPGPAKPAPAAPPAAKAAPPADQIVETPKRTYALPGDGVELHRRLTEYDGKLARQGLCQPGDLLRLVALAGHKHGYPASITAWSTPEQMQFAADEVKDIEARWRTPPAKPADPPPTPRGQITAEQVVKLESLAEEVGEHPDDVAAAYRKGGQPLRSMAEMTPDQFQHAMDKLGQKRPTAVAAE